METNYLLTAVIYDDLPFQGFRSTTNIHHAIDIMVPNSLKASMDKENRNSPLHVQEIQAYSVQSYSTPISFQRKKILLSNALGGDAPSAYCPLFHQWTIQRN